MAATFPVGIFAYTPLVDYQDYDYASNINAAYQEIVAIEAALGPNPHILHDASHSNNNTVGHILDTFDTAISTLQSKTANSYATLLGGPSTGLNVSAGTVGGSALGLQGYNNGAAADLYLQSVGGSLFVGSGSSSVQVRGSLSLGAGGVLTTPTLTVNGSAAVAGTLTANVLNVSTGLSAQTLAVSQTATFTETLSAGGLTLLQGAPLTLGGSETLSAPAANQSLWDGDQTLSTKRIHGHVYGYSSIPTSAAGWRYASFVAVRGDSIGGGNFSDYNPLSAYATYSNYGGGVGFVLQTDASAANKGWQSLAGDGVTPAPFYGSAFVVASGVETKTDVRDMEPGLAALRKLRPVTYKRKGQRPVSRGDIKKAESHGFMAEEMERVLPEAIHYEADGTAAGIDYAAVVALQAKAIQELERRLRALEARLGGPIA